MQRSKDGIMQYPEFKELLQCLSFWQRTFHSYDQNRTNFMEAHELGRCILEKYGKHTNITMHVCFFHVQRKRPCLCADTTKSPCQPRICRTPINVDLTMLRYRQSTLSIAVWLLVIQATSSRKLRWLQYLSAILAPWKMAECWYRSRTSSLYPFDCERIRVRAELLTDFMLNMRSCTTHTYTYITEMYSCEL